MGKKSRRAVATAVLPEGAPIPVVGGREPCPCGSGKRYRLCHGKEARLAETQLVTRPFEGLPGECDWVALRELVPAGTATVRTTAEHGAVDVVVATVLPMAWPALRRTDGVVMLGLQTQAQTGDPSRVAADVLLKALAAEPGTPIADLTLPGPGPRLQDVLDLDVPFTVTVHEGFDFWLTDAEQITDEVRQSLDQANAAVIPTVRLTGVEAAYWCRAGERLHLRWVLPTDEADLLDALARLQARGELNLVDGGKYAGAFRAGGLMVPVWDLPADTEPADVEAPAAAFAARLEKALAETGPLTVEERLARAGVVSRQVTLR